MVEIRKITKEQFESGIGHKPLSKHGKGGTQTTMNQAAKWSEVKKPPRPWVNQGQVTEYRPENNEWDRGLE